MPRTVEKRLAQIIDDSGHGRTSGRWYAHALTGGRRRNKRRHSGKKDQPGIYFGRTVAAVAIPCINSAAQRGA
jgi:hypothetical protein